MKPQIARIDDCYRQYLRDDDDMSTISPGQPRIPAVGCFFTP
ncbi:MAG TPA: hypothetical protein VMV75_03555 [Sulfuricella sp.]|nr:hypothetical protein [Sulfuricella sp.]